MKTFWFVGVVLLSVAITTRGQNVTSAPPSPTPYAVSSRDGNYNVWERTTYQEISSGNIVTNVHRYTEMATGLNYKNPDTGEWEPSSETIDLVSGGAAAQHGQHKVIFASDLATFGAIDMQTPDGKQLQSHLLGLSYFDRASGQSVFIAEVTNSIGQLIASNQVWYGNAFTGVKAGVRYTYTRGGFEQDIILEEQPPAPETYGLDSSTTVLQAFTEFISPPAPKILTNALGQLSDQTLSFGTMRIGRGRAFLMGDDSESCPVCKEWATIDGRQFLVEEVPVAQIIAQLQTLPAYQASLKVSNSVVNVVSKKRLLPPQPLAKASKNSMRIAKLTNPKPGFVIDYFTLNTTLTNYTFQASQTYYFSGNVGLYGTANTFDGGAVLKYASGVSLTVNTPVNWQAGPYRPVVMAAKDDITVGEPVSGATGTPGNSYYAAKALYFDGTAAFSSLNITNLRVLNAKSGVVINGYSGHTINDLQLVRCGNGIAATNTDFTLHNALFEQVLTNFTGSSSSGNVEQLTTDTATWLNQNIGTALNLTNCLLAAVTNLGSCNTQNVATVSSGSGVFQTVGGASYYLATNSPYRNAGTTNISPDTISALAHKTTYPPLVYVDTNITTVTTFGPVVQRDSDIPDLGFHYEPMDYAFCGVVAKTNISFNEGTAVGWFCTGSDFYGLSLSNKQVAEFDGTVENPDYYVRASTVQEGGNGNWTNCWAIVGVIGSADQDLQDVTLSPEWRMRFTTCSVLSWGEQPFRDWGGYLTIRAEHSTFIGGNSAGFIVSCYFTNCLIDGMESGQVEGYPGDEWIMRNCTWRGGIFYITRSHTDIPVSVRDCVFDGTTISVNDTFSTNALSTDYDYNAYTNATDPFPIGGTHDKMSVSFDWQTGPLGTYYLPGTLIDDGDTTADQVGLYHFTTQIFPNTPEGNSTVDIGYHYVAVDDSGNLMDTDGDGTPDYIEDANGNGVVDSGETDWQSATDMGLKVIITRPKNNSTIP